jgi:hypothetical protein
VARRRKPGVKEDGVVLGGVELAPGFRGNLQFWQNTCTRESVCGHQILQAHGSGGGKTARAVRPPLLGFSRSSH